MGVPWGFRGFPNHSRSLRYFRSVTRVFHGFQGRSMAVIGASGGFRDILGSFKRSIMFQRRSKGIRRDHRVVPGDLKWFHGRFMGLNSVSEAFHGASGAFQEYSKEFQGISEALQGLNGL